MHSPEKKTTIVTQHLLLKHYRLKHHANVIKLTFVIKLMFVIKLTFVTSIFIPI